MTSENNKKDKLIMEKLSLDVKGLADKIDTAALIARPLPEWRPVLSQECQVYVFGENYLAKRFDQINYKFCEKNEAKEILVDNLYALLRYKYFPKSSEEIDERINKIVSSFIANLKTTLQRVSFDKHSDAHYVKMLPDSCVAFRNGVFDFEENDWLFKYDIIKLKKIANNIYAYDPQYIIQWYLDYDFEPLPIEVCSTKLNEFIEMMKEITKTQKNYCFELMYNIAHDNDDCFKFDRFLHLCEILGYATLQAFSQHFVVLIGSGQNGKNSLFDGCFTNRLIPRPAANDLDAIENDRFITGALENKSHNIFLETSAKTYTESKMIKALTGSMYQTIESKGIQKYSGVINCKYIFAGNDQEKIKFSDTTTGFKRRINMLEIFYRWDPGKRFLKRGDYYDVTFSDTLSELKDDVANTTAFIYFAMYGIVSGTKSFKKNFEFTKNDWNDKYSDIDVDLKERIESITPVRIVKYIKTDDTHYDEGKTMLYDCHRHKLQDSSSMKELGYGTYDKMLEMLVDSEATSAYFADHDIYISVRGLKNLVKDLSSPTAFTQNIKKLYSITNLMTLNGNKPYVKCTFNKGKLKILDGKYSKI